MLHDNSAKFRQDINSPAIVIMRKVGQPCDNDKRQIQPKRGQQKSLLYWKYLHGIKIPIYGGIKRTVLEKGVGTDRWVGISLWDR